jgi:uncharacterized protein
MTTVAASARHLDKITAELKLRRQQVEATAQLLAEGGTVPFIARYRKEATGTLDEVAIAAIRDRLDQLGELDKRRESILDSLKERNLLTDTLQSSIDAAETLPALEDLYAPFRPKKRTRAMIAREAGLQPLADLLLAQEPGMNPEAAAGAYVQKDKGIEDAAAALQGARDILAEFVSDHADARAALRNLYWQKAAITSKRIPSSEEKTTDGTPANLPPETLKYKDYFDWSEPLSKIPSHRLLAIRRGAAENILYFKIAPPDADALATLEPLFLKNHSPAAQQVKQAVADAWKRLLSLSMETEIRLASKKKADEAAIAVFATNLRELLMASPLGQKTTLALDPGFRTGCKVVVLDPQGKLLHNDVVYPDQGQHKTAEADHKIRTLVQQHQVEAIAIGNGTASRETEQFIKKLGLPAAIQVVMVNESGASIYSASDVAREEFPNQDLTVRGSVSIGRRLQDPLAELVKLDPKSIGVGQYQHDVDQTLLQKSLDDTVVSCVNAVGVELNSASKQLLTYVSGLNPTIAENIVNHRNANGPFKSRKDLLNVPRLGPKTFEQAAGFLRIRNAENPLDASAVHPERYALVAQMAKDAGASVADLMKEETKRKAIQLQKYVTTGENPVGLPTLTDILSELAKPGRDPRQQFEAFQFAEGIHELKDLAPGMKLPGIVTNVTAFGAFVDVGVHQDGLVHISQLADRFIKEPSEVVKVHQHVTVTVVEVDLARKRIALSMRKNPSASGAPRPAPASTTRPSQPAPAAGGWLTAALQNAPKKKGGL